MKKRNQIFLAIISISIVASVGAVVLYLRQSGSIHADYSPFPKEKPVIYDWQAN